MTYFLSKRFINFKMAAKMNSLAFLPSGKFNQHFDTLILYASFSKIKEVREEKKGKLEMRNLFFKLNTKTFLNL